MILAGNERAKLVDVQDGYDDAVKREVHRCLTGFEPIKFGLLFLDMLLLLFRYT